MIFDSIIIGGGPSGLTAAIYLLRANKKVLILEKESIGGQISSSPLVENYPGYESISGSELANNMYDQVIKLGGQIELEEVISVDKNTVTTTDNIYHTKTIIIASGCIPRKLNINNEENLIGNGIHFCVSCDGAFYKDKIVAVIGGGNSAIINAIALSDICKKVYIIQNLDKLTAENNLVDLLNKKKNIEIILHKEVKEYIGEEELSGIILNDGQELKLDGLFLSIGQVPNSGIYKNFLNINDDGYIISDDCSSSFDNIFISGDIRTKKVRQITTATSDGTICALNVINYLNKN